MEALIDERGDAQRLADALYSLPAEVRAELLDETAEYLVNAGQVEQLAMLLGEAARVLPGRVAPKAQGAALGQSRRRLIAFGWYGGKFSHLRWLLPLLPQAHHYCEPYGGSAAVLLNREPSPVETYNDIDGEVVNFFRVLRNHPEELSRAIGLTPFSRQEFADAIDNKGRGATDLERARGFYVRARQVRTGLAQTASVGRWANCKHTSRAGMAGAVSRWLGGIDGLADIAQRLLRVQIENRPAIEIIRLYDSRDTLFYCDPPYPHETRGDSKAYEFEMTEQGHTQLAEVLSAVQGKVAISGYRCSLMDRLYPGWRVTEAGAKNCHSVKTPRTEALWTNY